MQVRDLREYLTPLGAGRTMGGADGDTKGATVSDRYRVLSLDGGGVRGLITSRLVERIVRERPGFLGGVDLFAGTSAGAILALALAAGIEPPRISDLYRDHGSAIFADDTPLDALNHADKLFMADYRGRPLKEALDKEFGSLTLGDLPKKVVVATFQLDSGAVTAAGVRSWKPKFFHNFPENSTDAEQLVVDVAMRSCAAPTFFPVYQGFIDGGVVANNPSMCALAQALDERAANQPASNVVLLSIGTGLNPKYVEGASHDWGYVQWARNIIGIVLGGSTGVADFQCRQVLGSRYHRLDAVLPRPINLDAHDEIPFLSEIGLSEDISETLGWLDRHWKS